MFRTAVVLLLASPMPLVAQVPVRTRFVPIHSPRSHVIDPARSVLHATTPTGLHRYDLESNSMLQPLLVGRSLRGIDITPDFGSLLVNEDGIAGSDGFVHRIDIASGTVTTIPYERSFGEGGSWDVAVLANDRAFVTT